MDSIKDTKEKKNVSSSYVYEFYKDLNMLTTYKCVYDNCLVKIKFQNGDSFAELEEAYKDELDTVLQNLRLYVNRTYIKYKAILGNLKKKEEDDKLKKSYNIIKQTYIIDQENIDNFVIETNQFLMQDVIVSLLSENDEYIKSLYS